MEHNTGKKDVIIKIALSMQLHIRMKQSFT